MDILGSSKQIRSKRAIEALPRGPRKLETSPRKQRAQEVTPRKKETAPRRRTPRKILPKPGYIRIANLRRIQKEKAETVYSQSEIDMCTWAPGRYLL